MRSLMRRRRLAIVLAGLTFAPALTLALGAAALKLAPRDYRLAWRLRRTQRIEYSSFIHGSRIIEITRPDEIAEIVSVVTEKLDRFPEGRMHRLPDQVHFLLDDGEEFVVTMESNEPDEAGERTFVRFPGESVLRPYATAPRLGLKLRDRLGDRPIELGRLQVDGGDLVLRLDWMWDYHHVWGRAYEISCPKASLTASPSRVREPVRVSLQGPRGTLDGGWDVALYPGFVDRHDVSCDLDEIHSVQVTRGSETVSFPLRGIRYHDLVLPPCPRCGSESVVPCMAEWTGPPPFKGRSRLDDFVEWAPGFFCEKCQKPF